MAAVLITGVSGFAGPHLVRALLEATAGASAPSPRRIVGIGLGPPTPSIAGTVEYHEGDVTDFEFVRRVVEESAPDRVFHLAAITFGEPESHADQRFSEVNVQGTRMLLEAILASGVRPRVHIAGSSAVYGDATEDPITESAPLRPKTLYAASKASQEFVALTYGLSHDLDVVVTRAFNHTGPGEHPHFASSTFARQIAEAEAGLREPLLRVGNLDAHRDFTDVRDVVRGYVAALGGGQPGECYNVCSGVARRVSEVLELLTGMARVKVEVTVDPARIVRAEVSYQRGSHERLTRATGWKPVIPFATTLADLLDSWRERVRGGAGTGGR